MCQVTTHDSSPILGKSSKLLHPSPFEQTRYITGILLIYQNYMFSNRLYNYSLYSLLLPMWGNEILYKHDHCKGRESFVTPGRFCAPLYPRKRRTGDKDVISTDRLFLRFSGWLTTFRMLYRGGILNTYSNDLNGVFVNQSTCNQITSEQIVSRVSR